MTGSVAKAVAYDVFALSDIASDKYELLREAVELSLENFQCSRSKHHEAFARSGYKKWESHGSSKTYVLLTATDESVEVAAFFTVGMTTINLDRASPSARKKLVGSISQTLTGAYSIAELARSDKYSGSQLPGSTILAEAKNVISQAQKYVAGRFVVVDSRPEVFKALYEPNGFKKIHLTEPPQGVESAEFMTSAITLKSWQ